jgi:hypothetical protein
MSHLTEAQFDAARIHCEEILKNVLAQIDKFNFRQEVKEKIIKDFRLDKAMEEITGITFTESYTALDSLNAIADRFNSYLSSVETYVAYNFDLEINDYRDAIKKAAELLVTCKDDIINTALALTEDEFLKTYIRAVAMSKKFLTTEDLFNAANDKMKNSKTYQKRALENARRILAHKETNTNCINENISVADFIQKINQESHSSAVSKAVRNRVLTAIIKIIKEQGFIVKKTNVEECGDHAKISAIKPNGEQANFVVHMNGKFIYKFHDYEGLSCEKDIGNFEEKFESVYGVKLEDKKILWSNPDRLDKMAHKAIDIKKIGG